VSDWEVSEDMASVEIAYHAAHRCGGEEENERRMRDDEVGGARLGERMICWRQTQEAATGEQAERLRL
jgi:hypothetical protein